jgi:hypothetical protein
MPLDDAQEALISPFLLAAMQCILCGDQNCPKTWIMGDTWVVMHGIGEWTIGPDEPDTLEQVRELLIQADGVFEEGVFS